MAKFKKAEKASFQSSKDFKEIHIGLVVNDDWLYTSINSIDENCSEEKGKAEFQKTIMFVLIFVDDTIVKVFIPAQNVERIKWNELNECRLVLLPTTYVSEEDVDSAIEKSIKRIVKDNSSNMLEIEPWRCKTFGLFTR